MNFSKSILIYSIFLIFFTLLMYFNLLRFYIPITQEIIPWGDPFTYEMSYYELLNRIKNGNFLSIASYIFESNWYWLTKILIFIFSPVIINEPYSLCLINYFVYGVASLLIFIYFKENSFSNSVSFFCSLLIWLYPINYNFIEYSAIPIMGLDSTFIGSLYCLIFSYLIFLKRKKILVNQLIFAICLCAAFVGRGNSIAVLGMLLLYPTVHFLYYLIKTRNFSDLKNFILPSIMFLFTVLLFYGLQLKHILNYYSIFEGFLSNSSSLLLPYLKHVPGIFFIYPDQKIINLMVVTDYRLVVISLICHLIVIFGFFYFKNIKNKNLKLGLKTGIFIFYSTFILNLLLWMNPHINIYNAQLIWAPMRIGLLLVVSIIFASYFENYKADVAKFFSAVSLVLIFFISTNLFNTYKTEIYKNNIDSNPQNIKRIQSFIKENADDHKSIILWYGPYLNPRIINYYSLKKGEKTINYYRGKYADDIWNQSSKNTEFINKVNYEIENIFNEADLIIIQENSKNYIGAPAFYRYSKFITQQIAIGKLDKFKLVATVKSSRGNLLIFKRSDEDKNFGYIINEESYKFTYQIPKNTF